MPGGQGCWPGRPLGGFAALKEAEEGSDHNEEGPIQSPGTCPGFRRPGPSAQRDWGSPEANRSADLMEWAQVSFIMKKKKKKNLIFHFPFLIEKYAVGVSLWFLVKGRIVVEPELPWGCSFA